LEWIAFRETETSAIEIGNQYTIHDFRYSFSPYSQLGELSKNKQVLIFGENISLPNVNIQNRLNIVKNDVLVIATIPADMEIIKTVITLAQPKEIWLMGINSNSDDMEIFLNRLVGMIRYALSHRQGSVSVEELAAMNSQRIFTIIKGIEWLVAHGDISVITQNNYDFKFREGGGINSQELKIISIDLQSMLKETIAFRHYYLRADPQQLLQ
jgi:hypothetical protein